MTRKLTIALVLLAALALQACGAPPANTGSAGQAAEPAATSAAPAAAATEAAPAAPAAAAVATGSLDPANATDETALGAIGHVYEGLVRLDNNKPALALAGDVTVAEDGLDYIFTLRPGVAFHDGTALNADAVLINFNRWFDPKDPLRGSGSYAAWATNFGGFKGETGDKGKPKSTFDGIEKVNDLTVLLHLNAPDADLMTKLASPAFSIVSPAALKAAGFGTSTGVDGGTGMYKIGSWQDTKLTLEPFSGYWNASVIPTSNLEVTLGQ